MNQAELAQWANLVGSATTKAMSSLSSMVGQEIGVASFALKRVPVGEITHLVGGPETPAVGIYLSVSGSADGHIMLMYDPHIACAFADMLMGMPPETTSDLSGMAESALGELANVVGSGFLNSLADATGTTLLPSPPTVRTDMAGALLDIIAADILLRQEHALVAETTFVVSDREISGIFFVVPSEGLLSVLMGNRTAV